MTNQDCSHNYDGHSSNADASDVGFFTDDRQSAREPTSGQWPTSNLPIAATAAFPVTAGSFPPNTDSLFTSHHQVSESEQASHYLDLQYPAHSHLPNTYVNRDDAIVQPTDLSQLQLVQYPLQREGRRESRSLEDGSDQLNRESLSQPTDALTHGDDPLFLLSSDLEVSELLHRKRRSGQDDLRPEVETCLNPTLKRRKLETQSRIDYTQVFHQPPLSSFPSPSQVPKPRIQSILACGLWALRQLTEKPTEGIKVSLACLCGEEDPSVMDTIFAASGPFNNDNTISNVVREAGGELWKSMNINAEPELWQRNLLSQVYGGSIPSWSNWFVRKRSISPNFDDSGHGTMTQTMTSVDREIVTRWRCNRHQCCRKWRPHGDLRRDPERKCICTSLCGKTFDSMDNWKKHERNNRMQRAYPCDFPKCREDPGSCVWSRKDELEKHLKTRHKDQKGLYKPRHIEIPANVRGNCLWRDCPKLFTSFEEFLAHMLEHFNNEWTAADLRGWEEETDAPLTLQAGESEDKDPDLPDSDDEDGGSPSPNSGAGPSSGFWASHGHDSGSGNAGAGPSSGHRASRGHGSGSGNAGAGPSSGHRASRGHGSGSGNSGSGSEDSAPNGSGTSRSGALGNKRRTCSSNRMHLKGFSPLKILRQSASTVLGTHHSLSAKQTWQQLASWSPKLTFLSRLGSGATAVVDEVSIAGVTGTLACKTSAAQWRAELFQELQTMSRLRHPHIVASLHAYSQAGFTSILMQPVADYNLSQYLAKNTFTPTEQCNLWLWFSCLTSGLHHMHVHGVLHHDIKPSNILVMNKQVIYSDFESSASMADNQPHKNRRWGFTRIYAAPEVFQGDRRTASDIFSLGCVFLEMITVLFPKDLRQQLHGLQSQAYQKNRTSLHWASTWINRLRALSKHQMTGSKVRNLLQICQEMTDPQPDQRPSAAEVDKRLNPRLCRSCSYSTKWPGRKDSRWSLDQTSLKSLRGLHLAEKESAKAKQSVPSRSEELSRASQILDQLSLEDVSDSGTEELLPETSGDKTIKKVRVNHKIKVVRSMMPSYLMDQDPYEKDRASGASVLPKLFNAVRLLGQYPTYINI